jgi:hypothetical protein
LREEITLNLLDPDGKVGSRGSIVVRVLEEKPEKVGAEAIIYARTTSNSSGISRSGIQSQSKVVDGVQGGIDLVDSGSVTSGLGDLVSKLNVLVNVIDEVAKVRTEILLTSKPLTDPHAGPSLCQSRMDDYFFPIPRKIFSLVTNDSFLWGHSRR